VLNLNLGYSIDSWAAYWLAEDDQALFRVFRTIASYVPFFGWGWPRDGRATDSMMFHLTDGGHFDNTGVYALIRRGCRLIICSDAGWDEELPNWGKENPSSRARAFEDVRTLEERIYSDFGARLDVSWESYDPEGKPRQQVPSCLGEEIPLESRGDGRVLVATIKNLPISGQRKQVVILFVQMNQPKLTRLRTEFGTIDREKARNQEFGDDPTADQLYTEDRVLAYRELGMEIVESNLGLISWAIKQLDGKQ
jgi:hypothetical protein